MANESSLEQDWRNRATYLSPNQSKGRAVTDKIAVDPSLCFNGVPIAKAEAVPEPDWKTTKSAQRTYEARRDAYLKGKTHFTSKALKVAMRGVGAHVPTVPGVSANLTPEQEKAAIRGEVKKIEKQTRLALRQMKEGKDAAAQEAARKWFERLQKQKMKLLGVRQTEQASNSVHLAQGKS